MGRVPLCHVPGQSESFHKPVSRKVIFWSIFGILAALAALVVIGLIK
jgi:hypothetical protein